MSWTGRVRHTVPNALTLAGAAAGFAAIRYAHEGRYALSAWLILAAAALDFADGFAARTLSATTGIGGELDSFADFLSFGVAPAFLAYEFTLVRLGPAGWAMATIYIFCTGYRLARFNVKRKATGGADTGTYQGLPSTGAAIILAVSVLCEPATGFAPYPVLGAALTVALSLAMLSRRGTRTPASIIDWARQKRR